MLKTVIADIDRTIENYNQAKRTAKLLLPKFGEIVNRCYATDSGEVTFRVGAKDFMSARRILGKGWKRTWSSKSNSGTVYINYRNYPHRISLILTDENPSCRRVQVGVEEVPVYEIVCD